MHISDLSLSEILKISRLRASEAVKREPRELKTFAEIAAFLANKLTDDEMYYVVLAIEDSDFHAAVIQQWQNMPHPGESK